MKKNISIILVFTLIISMCSGALCADEAAFEEAEVYEGDAVHVETVYEGDVSHVETVYEGDAAHIETVFEDPSNRDEEKYVTADSVVFTEEYVTGDSSLAEESDYVWDDMSGEAVSPDDVSSSYEDDELLSDDSVLSEEEVISEDTITDDSSFENVTASGTCGDNLTWVLTGEEGDLTLTVSGSGEMENFEGAPWYEFRSGIFRVILSDGVTSIGTGAFYDCCNLVSITLPDSVTGIGESAFVNCCNLKNITIPDSVTVIGDHAFSECKGLTGITIPNSIISIGAGAFSDTGLTGFTVPDSVTSIGNHAFGKCAGLQGINVSGDNPAYSSYDGVLFDKNGTILICCPGGKQGEYIIPDHVTGIGDYAFSDCESLSSIIIPNSVTSIGDNAFSNCRSLTGITIPDSQVEQFKELISILPDDVTLENKGARIKRSGPLFYYAHTLDHFSLEWVWKICTCYFITGLYAL